MKGPAPLILVLTVVIALLANASPGQDPGVVSVYRSSVAESLVWNQDSVPVDRLVAIVDGPEGLARIGIERAPLKAALDEVEVDFETQVLLVAYMGAVPTGGHSIEVADVQILSDREGEPTTVVIRLGVAAPSGDDLVTQAIDYPADVVAIHRSAWPKDVLEAVLASDLGVEATDQDGRDWGPVVVYR